MFLLPFPLPLPFPSPFPFLPPFFLSFLPFSLSPPSFLSYLPLPPSSSPLPSSTYLPFLSFSHSLFLFLSLSSLYLPLSFSLSSFPSIFANMSPLPFSYPPRSFFTFSLVCPSILLPLVSSLFLSALFSTGVLYLSLSPLPSSSFQHFLEGGKNTDLRGIWGKKINMKTIFAPQFDIFSVEVEEIARQMCIIEFRLFSKIQVSIL